VADSSLNNPGILFEAAVADSRWLVRLNDFPDEPLYTLLIDDTETLHFEDWQCEALRTDLPANSNESDSA
jgi:hypothetical protein